MKHLGRRVTEVHSAATWDLAVAALAQVTHRLTAQPLVRKHAGVASVGRDMFPNSGTSPFFLPHCAPPLLRPVPCKVSE